MHAFVPDKARPVGRRERERSAAMPWTPEQQAVLDLLRAEWAAFYAGDFDGVSRCWLPSSEVRRMASGPHVGTSIALGWDALSAQFREVLRRAPQDYVAEDWLRWDNLQIHVSGDMAWASFDQVALQHDGHILAGGLTHEIKILHRVAGAWKLVSLSVVVPALGRNDVPQIEIGLDDKVSRINDLARDRLTGHPGLVLSGATLMARNRTFDAGLRADIAHALDVLKTTSPPGLPSSRLGATPLGEDDFGRPLYCWVTAEQSKALVTFDDAAQMKRRLNVAAETYALSPAQHALCELLADGHDLTGASEILGVSVNTLRTQLRRMFEKTGTRSQTALVSALLTVRRPR